jgi:hypothetical protein
MLVHRPIKHNQNFAEEQNIAYLPIKQISSHMKVTCVGIISNLTNNHMVLLMKVQNWFHPDEETTKQHKSVNNLLSKNWWNDH